MMTRRGGKVFANFSYISLAMSMFVLFNSSNYSFSVWQHFLLFIMFSVNLSSFSFSHFIFFDLTFDAFISRYTMDKTYTFSYSFWCERKFCFIFFFLLLFCAFFSVFSLFSSFISIDLFTDVEATKKNESTVAELSISVNCNPRISERCVTKLTSKKNASIAIVGIIVVCMCVWMLTFDVTNGCAIRAISTICRIISHRFTYCQFQQCSSAPSTVENDGNSISFGASSRRQTAERLKTFSMFASFFFPLLFCFLSTDIITIISFIRDDGGKKRTFFVYSHSFSFGFSSFLFGCDLWLLSFVLWHLSDCVFFIISVGTFAVDVFSWRRSFLATKAKVIDVEFSTATTAMNCQAFLFSFSCFCVS